MLTSGLRQIESPAILFYWAGLLVYQLVQIKNRQQNSKHDK